MKQGRKPKQVFVFDFLGSLIATCQGAREAQEKFGLPKASAISTSIARKNLVYQKWYFSYNKEFRIPYKKSNFNPLLGLCRNKNLRQVEDLLRNDGYVEEMEF